MISCALATMYTGSFGWEHNVHRWEFFPENVDNRTLAFKTSSCPKTTMIKKKYFPFLFATYVKRHVE